VCVRIQKGKKKEKYEHHQHYEKKVFNPTPLSGTPSYGGSSIEAVEVKTKMNRVEKKNQHHHTHLKFITPTLPSCA
jgi:hypothetical protein